MLNPFFNDFSDYCKNLNPALNSVNEIMRYVDQLNTYLKKHLLNDVNQITYKHHLFNYLTNGTPASTTVEARIWDLKKFFSFLYLNEYIKDNIAKDLMPPKIPRNETTFLSEKELKIIMQYAAANLHSNSGWRNFIVLLLMAVQGFRKSTVVLLDAEDFEPQNNRIFINEKGSEDKRSIPIPFAISALLQEYQEGILNYTIEIGFLLLVLSITERIFCFRCLKRPYNCKSYCAVRLF